MGAGYGGRAGGCNRRFGALRQGVADGSEAVLPINAAPPITLKLRGGTRVFLIVSGATAIAFSVLSMLHGMKFEDSGYETPNICFLGLLGALGLLLLWSSEACYLRLDTKGLTHRGLISKKRLRWNVITGIKEERRYIGRSGPHWCIVLSKPGGRFSGEYLVPDHYAMNRTKLVRAMQNLWTHANGKEDIP